MVLEALLALTLCPPAAVAAPDDVEQICALVPPAPRRLEVTQLEASDGRMWGVDARYLLSTGDFGEALLVIDVDGNGEAYLAINGEIIAHTVIDTDSTTGQQVTTTWWPEQVAHPPELIAELMRVDLPGVVADSIPQEFKCSGWAKKMLKAGRYLWAGSIAVAQVACCGGTFTVGCGVCVGTGTVVGLYVDDKLANHCD